MIEAERNRCDEYSRAIFGKALKPGEIADLASHCSSYEEFRIRVVLKYSVKTEVSKRIAANWEENASRPAEGPDANLLLHQLESLSQKQSELERRMRDASVDLLEKLKAIDSHATGQALWRKDMEDIRIQVAAIRKRLNFVEDVPRQRGNGSK